MIVLPVFKFLSFKNWSRRSLTLKSCFFFAIVVTSRFFGNNTSPYGEIAVPTSLIFLGKLFSLPITAGTPP